MRPGLLPLLACPSCEGPLCLEATERAAGDEVIAGHLRCGRCSTTFPIESGVPCFLQTEEQQSHVARSFGFEWSQHHKGSFEKDSVFGRSLEEDVSYFFSAFGEPGRSIANAVVVDAGCGSGVLTVELARRNPDTTFIAMDINDAVHQVYRRSRDLKNLHVVRASVLQPPFREASIEYLWSNGVIHHTGSTRAAFNALVTRVRPGGKAYLWVYQRKLSPMVALRTVLMPLGLTNWNHWFLYRFCQFISAPTWIAVKLLTQARRIPGITRYTHLRILTLNRGYRELVLTWFDVLSPRYRDTISKRGFESWFTEMGFTNLKHHHWPVGICGVRTADLSPQPRTQSADTRLEPEHVAQHSPARLTT